ncbi:MAG: (E)-4-hydroxy-3-methylbut-2-enyl-diphosphate synthase [Halanaerobium sp. 4-GBenrich]|jgi:(E)-4-hydroxy-3-methylbut-2-enyl-diphosphate synthase|uniref:4-hydroxy-3-methylbut-2-en-1-yl diphosphate synthase (flavodoxin) n=1 Tax=Halanaerobium congolense TaxID=54121 RepID=A0A1M7GTQ3_9FIRM|nr:flavodoxin-dependent (E)-4-hydroxy-3-methylbut-2-enyl-diphosphate synthase [Halanaerobium congolense]KXS50292.1 MAG: (E)-4-hydroxy-3-methylbut-2-enyl-diphosphate synthase [Halanaerobium sp. T82-1]ODS50457.1 MAG: (E)-4-hydroxy-3-methylbut-2-enyl-diphosphate synthase [Halanaerobium sp. 4-GBenrich]OEG62389.1 MAG: 4-hydroxy-3-methylbut-2-en-1-yl diphosphate synthase [Halanaerobium sp. MDAL1]PTX17105.1 4-hydroxy-3-methylbut-2-en-1-yl diphosphate synthase [Halanaerobium congolense]PXV69319.1 4-hy
MYNRRQTKLVHFAEQPVGGNTPISVQSMCNTKTENIEATVEQIKELEAVGCEIIRAAVPDKKAAQALSQIKKRINIPLVADVHFDYQLALMAVENGVDALRINPGNIGSNQRIKEVALACKNNKIPIRVGSNSGSIEKELLAKHGGPTAAAMVESALRNVRVLEENNFYDIVISLKSSHISTTLKAYRLMAEKVDYPFHIGITESGTPWRGTIKSAAGIASLLTQGFGDTLRVSLTGDPVEEVRVGWQILKSLELRKKGVEIISCPTCGRTNIDLIALAEKIEKELMKIDKDITVAVMGCAVNGPGEAKEADIGVAGGMEEGLIFKSGEIIKKVKEDQLLEELLKEIKKL